MCDIGAHFPNRNVPIAHVVDSTLNTIVVGEQSGTFAVETGTAGSVVQMDGQPVGNGRVPFYNAKRDVGATEDVASDGSYSLPEPVPVRRYIVSVMRPDSGSPLSAEEQPEADWNIPDKYSSEATSDISVEIQAG
ncbi:MAG: hypothetical protein KDA79_05605 [Planctomycetaceae bacterium]|nr:hypothetical protein [Planctomycetaceae bacterium]